MSFDLLAAAWRSQKNDPEDNNNIISRSFQVAASWAPIYTRRRCWSKRASQKAPCYSPSAVRRGVCCALLTPSKYILAYWCNWIVFLFEPWMNAADLNGCRLNRRMLKFKSNKNVMPRSIMMSVGWCISQLSRIIFLASKGVWRKSLMEVTHIVRISDVGEHNNWIILYRLDFVHD